MLNEPQDLDQTLEDDALTLTGEPSSSQTSQPVKEPFLSPVQGNDFFSGGHWGQCLDLMAHLCQFSEHVLVLTGEHGVGKSTLKQALIKKAESHFRLLTLTAERAWDVPILMRRVAQGFGLEWEEGRGADIWQAPGRETPHDSPFSQTWVLLLDNADNLSDKLIESLLSLSREGVGVERQLHLLFIGKPEFEKRLNEEPFKSLCQGRVHTISLEPLSLSETEAYLNHKWRVAGFKKPLPFTSAQIKQLYRLTQGVPLAIDKLAKAHLQGDTIPEAARVTSWGKALSPMTITVASLAAILLLGLTVLPAVLDEGKEAAQVAENKESVAAPITPPVQTVKPQEKTPETTTLSLSRERSFVEKTKEEKIAQLKALAQELAAERRRNEDLKASSVEKKQPVKSTPVQQAARQATPVSEYKESVSSKAGSTLALKQTPPPVKEVSKKVKPVVPKVVKPKVVATEKAQKTKLKPKVVEKTVVKKKQPVKTSPYTDEERKLLSQKANRWTLQLIGLTDKARVKPFIQKNHLSNQAMTYTSNFKGKPWTVIIYGNYATKDQAAKAVGQLPKAIQNLKPWPRPYKSIQKEIREKHQS